MSLRITPAVRQDFRRFNLAVARAREEYLLHPFAAERCGATCAARGCPAGLAKKQAQDERRRAWMRDYRRRRRTEGRKS